MTDKNLASSLFTCDSWGPTDTLCSIFSNVVLKVKIGDFPIGTKFDYAKIDGRNSVLTLEDKDKKFNFNLKLTTE